MAAGASLPRALPSKSPATSARTPAVSCAACCIWRSARDRFPFLGRWTRLEEKAFDPRHLFLTTAAPSICCAHGQAVPFNSLPTRNSLGGCRTATGPAGRIPAGGFNRAAGGDEQISHDARRGRLSVAGGGCLAQGPGVDAASTERQAVTNGYHTTLVADDYQ